MSGISPLMWGLFVWAAITSVFVILMIYRSLITMREDDQLFLDPTQTAMESEQRAIQQKLNQIRPFAKGFGFASAGLGVGLVGLWVFQAITRFNSPAP
jgi:membrane protein insertase Oxa1/YidC/SpoIIIJ